MTLDRDYLERRESESVAAARAAASREAFIVHTRLGQLYWNEIERLERAAEEHCDHERHPLYTW